MRIAQVAPMYEAVPPSGYGGTERVVSYLTEELVRRGHEVTLFASGDSRTSARLVPTVDRALRNRFTKQEMQEVAVPMHAMMVSQVLQQADSFDVIHSHVDYLAFGYAPFINPPLVSTLHGRLDLPHLKPVLQQMPSTSVVSISRHQRLPLEEVRPRWVGVVYNGVPVDEFPFVERPGEYLAFVGRISPEKRTDWAIEIARRTGIPIKIAAKVDPCERDYYENVIKPLMDPGFVEFLGEVGEDDKRALMADAYAMVFPIDWPEPFGMVMIEAMACGTPVLALNRGAVPEVVRHGVSGFIGRNVDDLVAAAPSVAMLDRRACRREAQRRFSVQAMANGYEEVYRRVIAERRYEQLAFGIGAIDNRLPISA